MCIPFSRTVFRLNSYTISSPPFIHSPPVLELDISSVMWKTLAPAELSTCVHMPSPEISKVFVQVHRTCSC